MGILVAPDDQKALQEGIALALQGDSEQIKRNARSYAEQHLDKNQILSALEGELYAMQGQRAVNREIDYKNA